jgi:poly(3-hydroxybutyrate) depolymerase
MVPAYVMRHGQKMPLSTFTTLLCVLAPLALGTCSSSGGPGPVDPPPVEPPRLSPGCNVKGKPTGELLRTQLSAGGKNGRRYSYFVPSTYKSDAPEQTPLPLVFDFHGMGGLIPEPPYLITSVGVLKGDSTPAIFVFPQGLSPAGDGGYGWHGVTSCSDYDVAFFDAIYAEITSNYCVDLRKVFSEGFSFGASMTQALACCRGDKLRAMALQSGGPCVDGFCQPAICPTTNWPSARYGFGTGDSNTAGGDGSFTLAEFQDVVEESRLALQCSTNVNTVSTRCDSVAPGCHCVEYQLCKESKRLVRCEYPGSGQDMHTYQQPDYPKNVWDFYLGFQ